MHYKGNYYNSNQEICVTAQLYMPHCLEWLWTTEVTRFREALELGRWCLHVATSISNCLQDSQFMFGNQIITIVSR
jgi:hypothetical protein